VESDTPVSADETSGDEAQHIAPGTVIVHVTDKNGANVASAEVTLAGQTRKTDANGNATFDAVPAGTQTTRIVYGGASHSYTLKVADGATGQKFTLVAAAASVPKPIPVVPLVIFSLLTALTAAGAFLLRRSLRKMLGTGHAQPIKTAVAVTLALFFIGLIGILVTGLLP
jgi:hypothetical protein